MIAIANTENMVAPEDGCPNCGERDADRLVWREDESVECQRCGTVYRPEGGAAMAEREDSFAVDRVGRLIRSVTPARGEPYQHTCAPDVFTEVSHLAGELEGFTLEDLVERTGFPSSQVATALAFLKERGIVEVEARRCFAATADAHLDAMTEYHALREEGEAAFDHE